MAISPTDIRILFTNCDIIAYFLNLTFCSEHFISIKHRILAAFNINKKKSILTALYSFNVHIIFFFFISERKGQPNVGPGNTISNVHT
jgi:hypothetical protein